MGTAVPKPHDVLLLLIVPVTTNASESIHD